MEHGSFHIRLSDRIDISEFIARALAIVPATLPVPPFTKGWARGMSLSISQQEKSFSHGDTETRRHGAKDGEKITKNTRYARLQGRIGPLNTKRDGPPSIGAVPGKEAQPFVMSIFSP